MNKLQNCIVAELEYCEESTPANLVESMFKFIRNETPCVNVTVVRIISFTNISKNLQLIRLTLIMFYLFKQPPRTPKTKGAGNQSGPMSSLLIAITLLVVTMGISNY